MCGIMGYIGSKNTLEVLLQGLERMEYRGYDSAGIAALSENPHGHSGSERSFYVKKTTRQIQSLRDDVSKDCFFVNARIGIGHTRWATHGGPSERNAHPHFSRNGTIAVVHNGIIENNEQLKVSLAKDGYDFQSETDTEVIAHLIERELLNGLSFEEAVAGATKQLEGSFAIAVISSEHPQIVVSRKDSPLIIGIGTEELFLASDHYAFAGNVEGILELENHEIFSLFRNGRYARYGREIGNEVFLRVVPHRFHPEYLDKGGYPHFMLKEILEQPRAIESAMKGRIGSTHEVIFPGMKAETDRLLASTKRIVIVACGTSLYAGMAGKLIIESLARVPVEVNHASEFRYNDPILLQSDDMVVAVSQSGETADTIKAVEIAKLNGIPCLGLMNRVGTALTRIVDDTVTINAGPECAVASTKAFSCQVALFTMLALKMAELRRLPNHERRVRIVRDLACMPSIIESVLRKADRIKILAEKYARVERVIYIARGFGVPIIYEAGLKIKEVAYKNTEAYPAGELKHGPLALVEDGIPVFAVVSEGEIREKMLSNMNEVRARGGQIIALCRPGDMDARRISNEVIEIPAISEELVSMVIAPIVQLFAYYTGVALGYNVDKPRNLAKSVTTE